MVYNVDELVKRMAAGETPDAIAAEMTNMLNAASVQHQNAIRAEEEAKRVAQRKEDEKRQEMTEILLHIADFLQKHYPDLCADALKNLSSSDKDELFTLILNAVLEALDETAKPSKKLPLHCGSMGMDPFTMALMADMFGKAHAPDKQPKPTKSEDEVLNDFLGKICH